MNKWQKMTVRWTVVGHVIVIAMLFIPSLRFIGCRPEPEELVLDVGIVSAAEFDAAIAAHSEPEPEPDPEPDPEPEVVPPEPEPEPDPEPEVVPPEPDPEPDPEPEPERRERPEIKIGPRIVREPDRSVAPPPSAEELFDALGGVTATATGVPTASEIQIGISRVAAALKRYWVRDGLDSGTPSAEVTVWLGAGGRVTDRKLTKSSGVPALDRSVMAAANAVKRIDGLSPQFLKVKSSVSVEFEVE